MKLVRFNLFKHFAVLIAFALSLGVAPFLSKPVSVPVSAVDNAYYLSDLVYHTALRSGGSCDEGSFTSQVRYGKNTDLNQFGYYSSASVTNSYLTAKSGITTYNNALSNNVPFANGSYLVTTPNAGVAFTLTAKEKLSISIARDATDGWLTGTSLYAFINNYYYCHVAGTSVQSNHSINVVLDSGESLTYLFLSNYGGGSRYMRMSKDSGTMPYFVVNTSSEQSTLSQLQSNYDANPLVVDKTKLYGLCDLSYQEISQGVDYTLTHQLINEIGSKVVRTTLQAAWILADPTSIPSANNNFDRARNVVKSLHSYGFDIIGCNHTNFHPVNGEESKSGASASAKPRRNLTSGSYYLDWLDKYEQTWYTLASFFPEIQYWEIDNEENSNAFFSPTDGGNDYTLQEKALIYTDMLYFASRGIHRANPQAATVMGGVVFGNHTTFMNYLYSEIETDYWGTSDYDDFFEIACWHPYMQTTYTKTKFINDNNAMYNIISSREGKDKKVFFSEYGNSEALMSKDLIPTALEESYDAAADFPYLESMCYFRLFDAYFDKATSNFGLFNDPITEQSGVLKGSPKNLAKIYQNMAGGTGTLLCYQESIYGPAISDDPVSYRMDQIFTDTYSNNYEFTNGVFVNYRYMHGSIGDGTLAPFTQSETGKLVSTSLTYAQSSRFYTGRNADGSRDGIIIAFEANTNLSIVSNRCGKDATITWGADCYFNVWKKSKGSSDFVSLSSLALTNASSKLNDTYITNNSINAGDTIYYEYIVKSSLTVNTSRNFQVNNESYLNFDVTPTTGSGEAFSWSKSFLDDYTCDPNGQSAPSSEDWGSFKDYYDGLNLYASTIIKQYDVDACPNSHITKALEKYCYIINKYGTDTYENFIGISLDKFGASETRLAFNDNTTMIVCVIISISAISAASLCFVIRRRKNRA